MRKYFYIILACFLLFINCKNNHTIDVKNERNTTPKIEFLKESNDSDRFYVIDNFEDNEKNIKYLFHFAENIKGWIWILTDKNGVEFEGNIFNSLDTRLQRFSFFREKESFKNKSIKVNFLENTPVQFTTKKTDNQTYLTTDFETLTVNTVQNFLDYIYVKEDDAKKEKETYSYILSNKNNQEKMKLIYHEYGEWFEVEVL